MQTDRDLAYRDWGQPDITKPFSGRESLTPKEIKRPTPKEVHCGEVGIVRNVGQKYPDNKCRYYVKFKDGDERV